MAHCEKTAASAGMALATSYSRYRLVGGAVCGRYFGTVSMTVGSWCIGGCRCTTLGRTVCRIAPSAAAACIGLA